MHNLIDTMLLLYFHRQVFISNTEASTPCTFVLAASRSVPSVQYVRMSETLWHRHIFYACKAFTQSTVNRKLLLATCLGRQPGSDVWVLNELVQVRGSDGQPMSKNTIGINIIGT